MTQTPPTAQAAGRSGTRRRVRRALTRARTLWRDMTGESAYDRYLERYAREHTDCPNRPGGAHGPAGCAGRARDPGTQCRHAHHRDAHDVGPLDPLEDPLARAGT